MILTIKPSEIFGDIYIQISKSDAHRALVASFLAEGESVLKPWMENVGIDIIATKEAISNFANFKLEKDCLKVIPKEKNINNITIDVKESGSSLRLLIPVVSALNNPSGRAAPAKANEKTPSHPPRAPAGHGRSGADRSAQA